MSFSTIDDLNKFKTKDKQLQITVVNDFSKGKENPYLPTAAKIRIYESIPKCSSNSPT